MVGALLAVISVDKLETITPSFVPNHGGCGGGGRSRWWWWFCWLLNSRFCRRKVNRNPAIRSEGKNTKKKKEKNP